MNITFESIGQETVTFLASTKLRAGMPCKLSGNKTVAPCAVGDAFCGVAGASKDGLVGVQLRGFVTLGYVGTAPTLGYCSLAAAGQGKVKVSEGARSYLVVDVDVGKAQVCILL